MPENIQQRLRMAADVMRHHGAASLEASELDEAADRIDELEADPKPIVVDIHDTLDILKQSPEIVEEFNRLMRITSDPFEFLSEDQWTDILVAVITEADYDLGKQYDVMTAEEPEEVEYARSAIYSVFKSDMSEKIKENEDHV